MPPPRQINLEKILSDKNGKGFTLAEALITLGIIGIVAALIIPSFINNHRRKVLETQFKKGYSNLQNAYLIYSSINYNDPNDFISETEWYKNKKNIKPFLDSFHSGIKCYGNQTPINGQCGSELSDKYWGSLLRYNGSPIHRQGLLGGGIKLNDGSTITLFNNGNIRNEFIILLDSNGAENKPNRVGYDVFCFNIVNKRLVPIAPYGTSLFSTNIVIDPQGASYTYYATQNICPTKSDKTYWECLQF